MNLDDTDKEILRLLQQDAKMTIKELSSQLSLSATPIYERIKKMEQAGIIKAYVALIDADKVGKKLNAFANISIKDHSKSAVTTFVQAIEAFPEVMECHYVSGNYDFLIKVLVEDMENYNHFIMEKLSAVSNIGKVETLFSLSTSKRTSAIPM
ncbi:MAG: Lrp/AsnC family transcriptional regulator [Bacteroidota bacterium]